MPHVRELPAAQYEALLKMECPPIRIKVLLTATYKTVTSFIGGVPTFGSSYATFQADVSDRLIGDLNFSGDRPIFPDSDSFSRGELQIALNNSDTYIATLQNGSMIRLGDIDQGEFIILAEIEGVAQPLSLFRGRITGPPREELGVTTFTCTDTTWDAMRQPVLYEDFATATGSQTYQTFNGQQAIGHRQINTANGHFCAYMGMLQWDAQGFLIPNYRNSDPDHRDLKGLQILNGAKLGQYKIFFTDAVNFTLTYPDNSLFRGAVGRDFISPFITIMGNQWTTDSYATGVTIDFAVGVCLKGNPITIARNFMEKGLLGNWGAVTGQTLTPKLDAAAWDAAEKRFQSYTIFLSETNNDNSVWERKRGNDNMPLHCLELAQRALDHVGCFLQMRRDGLISITTPFLDGKDIWDLDTANHITRIAIEPSEQFNYIIAQYGEQGGTFASSVELDLRLNSTDATNERVVSLPYYKAGESAIRAKWLAKTYLRRYARRQQTIAVTVTPQMALPIVCGDVVRIVSERQPAVRYVCEVVGYSMNVRGECSLKLAIIQQYEGNPMQLCVAHLDGEVLW